MIVPNELVDCILENLYFDRDTLFNCALVGRAWIRSSQRGIFREIVLGLPSQNEPSTEKLTDAYLKATRRLESLDALFCKKPYLASFVRSLELRWFQHRKLDAPQRAPPEVVYTVTASLVRRLSGLNSLSFLSVNWESLPPFLKVALTDLCLARSEITRFSAVDFFVGTCADLASLLVRMKDLKMLHITMSCTYAYDCKNLCSELEASHPPQSIQLDELRIGNHCHFVDWFSRDSCPFGFHNLKSLGIPSNLDNMISQYFGTSLKELTLYDYPFNPASRISQLRCISRAPNLRSLSLGPIPQGQRSWNDHPVQWIDTLLKPLLSLEGNLSPLQHLTISLYLENTLDSHYFNKWSALDTLLGKPEFASLETVEFKLAPAPKYPSVPDGASKLLGGNLPFLERSGKLHIVDAQIGLGSFQTDVFLLS
ncbi:hypothetical protein BT96DRAFT_992584 [Gymnopus androsaceus JB14]|uniref:F-box domain-containing protein n=1 Tax=Gymnopus androsaceus JB14 TaxID=1447944 RepID=A0A6A4HQZ2_9AGAR|nr:hypothetical protein BT96DRAFT_992584 [Gymnopus androsaceus JB14]